VRAIRIGNRVRVFVILILILFDYIFYLFIFFYLFFLYSFLLFLCQLNIDTYFPLGPPALKPLTLSPWRISYVCSACSEETCQTNSSVSVLRLFSRFPNIEGQVHAGGCIGRAHDFPLPIPHNYAIGN
jgi:hypothetical protein